MKRLTAAILAGLVLAACSGPAEPQLTERRIEMSEFMFTPDAIEMAAGESVRLVLENTGVVEHDFTLDATGLKVVVNPGRSAERTLGPLEPGTYEVHCSVAGHKEQGMTLTLEVR